MTVSRRVDWFSREQLGCWISQRLWWMRRSGSAASALALSLCSAAALLGAEARRVSIESVSTSRPFFNPSLDQTVRISFSVNAGGALSVSVLDRDGFLTRTLASQQSVQAGNLSYDWDGRNDHGTVVPDEAYSIKIDLETDSGNAIYFPASVPAEEFEIASNYFDRARATLSYRLPKAARVHVQAGCAVMDPRTKRATGPVLKTIANREPRPAGAVVDYWDGFDESGTIRVPDLPNFVVGVAGTSLPENVILTTGNGTQRFIDTVAGRQGRSLLSAQTPGHHHAGLDTLSDTTPPMSLTPSNASWSEESRVWDLLNSRTHLTARLTGPAATAFARQPGHLYVFIDSRLFRQLEPTGALEVLVPLDGLKAGEHIVAVNWASDYGPAAANALRVRIAEQMAERTATRGKHD